MDDLNKQVCELLGWTKIRQGEFFKNNLLGIRPDDYGPARVPDYTTDLNACFRDLVPTVLGPMFMERISTEWFCRLGNATVYATTPAEAICRAYIAMKEGE